MADKKVLDHLNGQTEIQQNARVSTEGILSGNAAVNNTLQKEEALRKFGVQSLSLLNNEGENPDGSGSSDSGDSSGSDVSGVDGSFKASSKAEYDKFKAELTKLIKEGKITFQTTTTTELKEDLVSLGMIQLVLYLKLAGANIKGSWGFGVMAHSVNVAGKSNMSRHKYGVAIDISRINGKHISQNGDHCKKLVDALARIVQGGNTDGSTTHEFIAPVHVVNLMKAKDTKPAYVANNSAHNDHLHFSIPKRYGLKNGYTKAGSTYSANADTGPGSGFYTGWIFADYAQYESIRDGETSIEDVGGGSSAPGTITKDSPKSELKAWCKKYVKDKYGWTGKEWEALDWLVEHESSWRPEAQNPTSTAYGLFQFLDSTWGSRKKTSDPMKQIEYGTKYVKDRYKTPTGAKAFWQKNHWY